MGPYSKGFAMALVMGACWILVASVLWAPISYVVYDDNRYVLESTLAAHTRGP